MDNACPTRVSVEPLKARLLHFNPSLMLYLPGIGDQTHRSQGERAVLQGEDENQGGDRLLKFTYGKISVVSNTKMMLKLA